MEPMVLGPRNRTIDIMPRRLCCFRKGQFPVPPVLSSFECIASDQVWKMPPKKNILSNSSNRDSDGGPSVKPPEFKGEVDPVASRIWLKEMEKAFTLTQISDNLRSDYADCLQNQLEVEFLELKQGEKIVVEYEAKFTELARLVPVYVSTQAQKVKRFHQGLKPETRSGVVVLQLKTYPSVVQAALLIESDQKLATKEKGDKKRKSEGTTDEPNLEGSSQRFQRRFGQNRIKRFRRQNFPLARPTTTSKGHYASECNSKKPEVTCYNYGKVGHLAGNCKAATQGTASQGPASSTAKARTFKITKRSNAQDSDVVAGQRQEKKFLSILKAKKLLRQGCETYLARVVDVEKEVLNLDEIPIVKEFLDVFPDELPGLPPNREIEFSIDLVPGVEPVSKAPYRMAPVK
ncbi:uncharacterized protein LOC141695837 [Apium graveolens]|uniref:uncharacterized protein LOC141695837 n=1 Tax=Apium graveolens TaxID=4045 RepID=UPI003D7A0DB0